MHLHIQIALDIARERQRAGDRACRRTSAASRQPRPSIRRSVGRRVIAVGAADRRGAIARAGSVPLRGRAGSPEPLGDPPVTIVAHELKASYAFIERNFFLTRRYWGWELAFLVYSVAGALSISLIGADQGNPELLLTLMVGAIFWNYLSVVFSWIAETIASSAGKAPSSTPSWRRSGAGRSCSARSLYAMVYGLVHTAVIFIALVLFFPSSTCRREPGDGRGVHAARLVQLRRHRHDGRDPAAALRRARRADDVRPPVVPAARQRRVLLDRGPAATGCRCCRTCRRRPTSSRASGPGSIDGHAGHRADYLTSGRSS